jgi:hypothetical protein
MLQRIWGNGLKVHDHFDLKFDHIDYLFFGRPIQDLNMILVIFKIILYLS